MTIGGKNNAPATTKSRNAAAQHKVTIIFDPQACRPGFYASLDALLTRNRINYYQPS
jgi:hypothetical protein